MPYAELARLGHDVQMSQRMGDWGREEADVIVGQRVVGNSSTLWQVLARSPAKLVYELDDDLFSIDARTNPHAAYFKQPLVRGNLVDNIRVADLVTVSTEPLADVVRKINPNVVVLPNCVRDEVFTTEAPLRRGKADGITQLGWQGSHTHDADWAVCRQAVIDALAVDPGIRMRFLGAHHFEGMPVGTNQVDRMPWQPDITKHYKRVARFDVSLAPLADTAFNRSKSGLRAQESLALGVPVIASDVPAYRPVVEHGRTGLLVRTRKEWAAAIDELRDPVLREVMGQAGRQAARAWQIETNVGRWVDAYRALL
jgi:glycosyltransferase involved in cell wall biosynthesis